MFGFKLPNFMSGMEGSAMSKMSDSQKLQALGAAFSGDQKGLGSLLASLDKGGGAPVENEEGQDISAAFGGQLGIGGQMLGQNPGLALGLPGMFLGRKFGFGKGR